MKLKNLTLHKLNHFKVDEAQKTNDSIWSNLEKDLSLFQIISQLEPATLFEELYVIVILTL